MKTSTILFLLIISNILMAGGAEEQLKKLNVKPEFHYENPFNHEAFEKVSGAKVLLGGITYRSSEMELEISSSYYYFLITGNNISSYDSPQLLFSSPDFFKTIRSDFKIKIRKEAEMFQDFLYLIDQNSSFTSYFKEGNDWYFIRRTFFEDIEAWKITTDENGTISAMEYNEKMDVTIPDEVYEAYYPSAVYNELEEYTPSNDHILQMNDIIGKQKKYSESATELTNESLSAISNAGFYEFSFTIEEEINDEEYGTYTSSMSSVFTGISFNNTLQLFYSFTEMVESPLFLQSLKPAYSIQNESDAAAFELVLDDYTNHMRSHKMLFSRDDAWYFVRDESFGEKEGFIVRTDSDGKISNISYSNNLGIDIPEEEFDETTADWGFNLIEPNSNSIEIVEGTSVNYALEFNEKPVTQMGAWIFASLNNENLDMYFGSEITSPHYGDVKSEELPIGKHILDIYLMRPGNDTETALDKASVEISVVPFNDEGVVWNFVMTEPKSNTVKTKTGESVPVVFTYNDEEANRCGVRLDIYFEGELVGGQKAPNHQSPFKIDIPGGAMKQGKNKVEFVFAGGSKTLARFEVIVEVE